MFVNVNLWSTIHTDFVPMCVPPPKTYCMPSTGSTLITIKPQKLNTLTASFGDLLPHTISKFCVNVLIVLISAALLALIVVEN